MSGHVRPWPKRVEWVAQVLNSAAAGETLQMNAGYFFRLLEHMTAGAFKTRTVTSCRCMRFMQSIALSCRPAAERFRVCCSTSAVISEWQSQWYILVESQWCNLRLSQEVHARTAQSCCRACKRACQRSGGACVDVRRQPENASKGALVARLEACKVEALERLPPSKRPAR